MNFAELCFLLMPESQEIELIAFGPIFLQEIYQPILEKCRFASCRVTHDTEKDKRQRIWSATARAVEAVCSTNSM